MNRCVCRTVQGYILCAVIGITAVAGAASGRPAGDEKRATDRRIQDFSYAGYRGGTRAIPDLPVTANVKEYGAVGDGITDDTAAFQQAIDEVKEGAVLIPRGKYRITGVLRIRKRGVVLRGEGAEASVLYFPEPLATMVGPGKSSAPGGSWSWSGGAVSFEGEDKPVRLGKVTASARRGDFSLTVATTAAITPGQWVRIVLTDGDGSLARYIYGGGREIPQASSLTRLVDFISPVASIDGARIVLQRPLRTDVLPAWKPEVWRHSPSVEDVGIEDVAIEFPEARYIGHHDEPGYNAVSFAGVSHCWVRRVHIRNADNGIFFRDRTKFCTISSVRFFAGPRRWRTGYGRDTGEPARTPVAGHHGILMANAYDNLIEDFCFDCRFIHDIGVSAWAAGNVFSTGRGIDIAIDHHRRGPYDNLFTDIDAGEGDRLWQSGGDVEDGPHSGTGETFWNIRTVKRQVLPPWSLKGNYIGVTSTIPSRRDDNGDWWEQVPSGALIPANLYQYQKQSIRQ